MPAGRSLADLATQFERTPDTVVAEVDGTKITLGMVADRVREFPVNLAALPPAVIYKGAVDDLIQQRALAIKAKDLGIDKTPSTIRHIEEAHDRALAQALMRRIVPEMVTDQIIQTRYDADIKGKPGPNEVEFRVIATTSEAESEAVIQKLSTGEDFATLAHSLSKDPSAIAGGEIGYTTRDKLAPEIAAVAFTLQPGQTTPYPVPTSGLWFVLRVEGRRQQGTPPLAQVKPALTAALTRQAEAEIIRKAQASVVVQEFGPTGARPQEPGSLPKTH